MKRQTATGIAILLILLTAGAVVQLFRLQFEAGDIYPPYSSLRSDPLGTRVLFEALEGVPDLEVERVTQQLSELPQATSSTLLILEWPYNRPVASEVAMELKTFAAAGNRIVLAFRSIKQRPDSSELSEETEEQEEEEETNEDDETSAEGYASLAEQFGFETDWLLSSEEFTEALPVAPREGEPLTLRSKLSLEPGSGWKSVFTVGDQAVIIERSYGDGSMVVMTESYPFSNEAMLQNRDPELLSWLIGPAGTVYFEETHFGIIQKPGMGTLIRKYGLSPAFVLLGIVGIFFIWRNAVPFVPRPSGGPSRALNAVLGKNADEARINLLRRAIPREAVIPTCMEQWREHCRQARERHPDLTAEAERLAAEETTKSRWRRNPLETYRAISKLFTQHRL